MHGLYTTGDLGGVLEPGCEFTASMSQKNKEKRYKIISSNEDDESELSSVMNNQNNSQLNKNIIFYTKNHVLCISFFTSDSTVLRKIYHMSYRKFLEAVNSQNRLCWIRQVATSS